MSQETAVVSFDFYGTLVQWHEGLLGFVSGWLLVKGKPAGLAAPILADFHKRGRFLRDMPPYKAYRAVLSDGMAWSFDRQGLTFAQEDAKSLIEAIRRLPVFPEVPAVLAHIKAAGFRIAVISNSDDDIIDPCVAASGLPIDTVVTAQQAGAYKPDVRLFTHAHEVLGVVPSQVTHVAASMALDMPVCKELLIKAIWVNRRNEIPDDAFRPFTEVRNLTEAEPHII